MVSSHIFVRLARMADCQTNRMKTLLWSHKIKNPLQPRERAESELFRKLSLKVVALSKLRYDGFSAQKLDIWSICQKT